MNKESTQQKTSKNKNTPKVFILACTTRTQQKTITKQQAYSNRIKKGFYLGLATRAHHSLHEKCKHNIALHRNTSWRLLPLIWLPKRTAENSIHPRLQLIRCTVWNWQHKINRSISINQANHIKSNQIESNQIKSNQTRETHNDHNTNNEQKTRKL